MTSFLVHIGAVLFLCLGTTAFADSVQWKNDALEVHAQFTRNQTGLLHTMEGGMPQVPLKPFHIALPAGFELGSVDVQEGNHSRLRDTVGRTSPMIPISWKELPPRVLAPAAAPNYLGNRYPAARYQVSVQRLHGASVAILNLFPTQALREGGSDFVDALTVRLNLKRANEAAPALFAHQRAELESFVDNREVVATYATRDSATYDYLIIATPKVIAFAGADGLADFQKSLTERGLTSKVASVADIDTAGGTPDRIENIRNFIRAEHKAYGIRYVLLAGRSKSSSSEPFLPSRNMYTKIKAFFGGSSWVDLAEQIPADHYYAALDGTFNYNGNGNWGEATDGDNGGDVDFLPEVSIGRVVVDTDQQLQQFVKKSVAAGKSALPKSTLLAGEMLFKEMDLYGDEYMDQLVGECTEHTYTTTGYPSYWTLSKLYDRTKGWSGTDAMAAINGPAVSMINHLGHSNNSTNFRLSTSSIAKMKNAQSFFYYSQGCFAGGFTQGSFIDKLVTAPYAAFAAVGNSTYGLAPEDPQFDQTKTPGASQMLHRQFVHAIFTKGILEAGIAHQESKRAFINLSSANEIRWVTWGATYFGDPSFKLAFD